MCEINKTLNLDMHLKTFKYQDIVLKPLILGIHDLSVDGHSISKRNLLNTARTTKDTDTGCPKKHGNSVTN